MSHQTTNCKRKMFAGKTWIRGNILQFCLCASACHRESFSSFVPEPGLELFSGLPGGEEKKILLIHGFSGCPPSLCAYFLPPRLSIQQQKNPNITKWITHDGSLNRILEGRWEHLHSLATVSGTSCQYLVGAPFVFRTGLILLLV